MYISHPTTENVASVPPSLLVLVPEGIEDDRTDGGLDAVRLCVLYQPALAFTGEGNYLYWSSEPFVSLFGC